MSKVSLKVNGRDVTADVEDRTLLVDLLREELRLTGTHVGCDTSQCGACLVLVDGLSMKSCTMFAGHADGKEVVTIEGIANDDELHPMQAAFREHHGLQCGFCTPGFLMLAVGVLEANPEIDDEALQDALSSNLCRCTGYQNIVTAVRAAAVEMRAWSSADR
jgi:carbon-monoxide dehydrogenase small subunit